jgi:dynein heavy chain
MAVVINVYCISSSLNDLVEFIKIADVGLAEEVAEGDYHGLVAVMGHLMAVKDRQATTDEMFEPLKQTIELLKTYGQELPEEVHTQLQVNVASLYVLFGI